MFETADAWCATASPASSRSSSGFPDEPDESVEATLAVIQRLRRMSPAFEVSVYFYQPYPGSPIADLVWGRGYRKPRTPRRVAAFD